MSSTQQVLALDISPTSAKAAVMDAATAQLLGPVAQVRCPIGKPLPDAFEVVAEQLWSAVTSAARQACRDFPGVVGVGLAARTPSLVLLDKADQPLANIWTDRDRRARPAARQAWAAIGDEFLATTGSRPLPAATSAVVYRQQLNDDPYLSHRARSYLHLNGWLALKMTGERVIDAGNASASGLFSTMTDRQWSKKLGDYFEVDFDWLPPVVHGTATIGAIRSAAAAELGLTAGIPLKLTDLEPAGTMLGAGLKPGDLWHDVGDVQTMAALESGSKTPIPAESVLTRLVGVGDDYLQIAFNPVGGVALEWIRKLCFCEQTEDAFYQVSLPSALDRPTRVLFDPPHLAGDPLEIEAHRAAFRDLTLPAERLDLLAAVVQAMLRGHQRAIEALSKEGKWHRVVMSGVGTERVQGLLPDYREKSIELLVDGALKGVAKLFSE